MADYCDCGTRAVAKCPLCGRFRCSAHWRGESDMSSRAWYLEAAGAPEMPHHQREVFATQVRPTNPGCLDCRLSNALKAALATPAPVVPERPVEPRRTAAEHHERLLKLAIALGSRPITPTRRPKWRVEKPPAGLLVFGETLGFDHGWESTVATEGHTDYFGVNETMLWNFDATSWTPITDQLFAEKPNLERRLTGVYRLLEQHKSGYRPDRRKWLHYYAIPWQHPLP